MLHPLCAKVQDHEYDNWYLKACGFKPMSKTPAKPPTKRPTKKPTKTHTKKPVNGVCSHTPKEREEVASWVERLRAIRYALLFLESPSYLR
jgi:hypothetical protein